MNNKVLILLDLQKLFFQGKKNVYNSKELLENILFLEKQAHKNHIPIVYIRQTNSSSLRKNTDSWQLHSKLKPNKNDYILNKKNNNAFTEPEFCEFLKTKKISTVIIAGLVSKCCVKATCIGARNSNYPTILVQDGHSDFRKDAHKIIEKINNEMKQLNVMLKKTKEIKF